MATSNQVKTGLNQISASITDARDRFDRAKARVEVAKNDLAAIPTKYADILAEIDGYTGADVFEELSKAEKARLTTDFLALQSELEALIAEF